MKAKRILGLLLALAVVITLVIYVAAQTKAESKTVTGCLQKGDQPDEFSITDASGNTYGLRSTSLKLADHLGHKVTVTGRMKGDKEDDEEREEKGSNKHEIGDIQVTNLTMVSASCQ